MANAKCSVKRDSLIELESYIEQAYNTTVNMSDNRQARMDVYLSNSGAVSTPICRSDSMNTNKRKAQSPLNTLLNISLESDIIDSDEIDKPLKAYLDKMTSNITTQITASSDKLEQLIIKQGSEIDELRSDNDNLKQRCQVSEGRLTRLEKVVSGVKEDLLRTQQQAMKENLVFQNLPEQQQDENVMRTLSDYMKTSLKISQPDMTRIHVIRAHRMGTKGKYPRSIVAKINDEGRHVIFKHTRNLKGQRTSVFTQLPMELAERRKQLVPIFKEAREKKIPAKWLGDKLKIRDQIVEVKAPKVSDINADTTDRACQIKVARTPPRTMDGSSFQGSSVDITHPDDVIPV